MQVSRINQSQTKNFKGTTWTTGPASWRSSGGGYSYPPQGCGYNWGVNPLMYMWLANRPTYVQSINAEDIKKEQREQVKDKIFLQENPELIKKKHPVMKGVIAGTIISIASTFLTKGIEIIKDADNIKINRDPLLIIASVFFGVLAGFAVKRMSMPNVRIERIYREEKSNQEKPEIGAQK